VVLTWEQGIWWSHWSKDYCLRHQILNSTSFLLSLMTFTARKASMFQQKWNKDLPYSHPLLFTWWQKTFWFLALEKSGGRLIWLLKSQHQWRRWEGKIPKALVGFLLPLASDPGTNIISPTSCLFMGSESSWKQLLLSLKRPYKDDHGDPIPVVEDITPNGQYIYIHQT